MSLELLVKKTFASLGYQIQQVPSHVWESDPKLQDIARRISGVTLLDPWRLQLLYRAAQQAAKLPGDVAEVGVYRGGTARLLCEAFEGAPKEIHLFDTFGGMPEVDAAKDKHKAGDFSDTSLDSVQRFLEGCGAARFHQGTFPQSAAGLEAARFALVHVDVDIYTSVKACCDFFYTRLAPGGIIVFDDYAVPSCPGARKAVDEFFAGKPERPLPLPTGQCLVVKLP
jgi:O-methyltransferase